MESGSTPNYAHIEEHIGPHQLRGDQLWFGKTYYDGEGSSGVGGFGYFDAITRSFELFSPPEIQCWSACAILVEPDFVWMGLCHRGEFGDSPGGVLCWDRKSRQSHVFKIQMIVSHIVREGDSLYLGGTNGIAVLNGNQIQSYFVDRNLDGSFRMVARN